MMAETPATRRREGRILRAMVKMTSRRGQEGHNNFGISGFENIQPETLNETIAKYTGSNCVLALILTACGKSAAPIRVYSGLGPNWYNADLSLLPFADDPGAMAEVALILSQRNAVEGQKYYAFKLAEMAFARSDERRIALAYSRAAYLLAEIEPDEDRMVEIAEKGLAAAEKAGIANKDPEANFYYALNLGLVLKTKGLFALGRLPKLQETLKIAMEKPEQDMGGPLRVLGMLYLSAPEWPQGIGDEVPGLLEQASTNYLHPQNHIFT